VLAGKQKSVLPCGRSHGPDWASSLISSLQ